MSSNSHLTPFNTFDCMLAYNKHLEVGIFCSHLVRSLSNHVSGILVDLHASQILISSIFFSFILRRCHMCLCVLYACVVKTSFERKLEIWMAFSSLSLHFSFFLLFNFFSLFFSRLLCRQIYYIYNVGDVAL